MYFWSTFKAQALVYLVRTIQTQLESAWTELNYKINDGCQMQEKYFTNFNNFVFPGNKAKLLSLRNAN